MLVVPEAVRSAQSVLEQLAVARPDPGQTELAAVWAQMLAAESVVEVVVEVMAEWVLLVVLAALAVVEVV